MRSLALALLLVSAPALAEPVVILVRHAEKVDESKDPPLSPAGERRAERLAEVLASANVTAVFTTELARTQATAAPLAAKAKLTPRVVPADDLAGLVRAIRAVPDGAALVVGHSNTLPEIAKALGVPAPPSIGHGDQDQLWIVHPTVKTLTVLRIGVDPAPGPSSRPAR